MQNTMVEQGLVNYNEQSYSERERMKDTPDPEISQGRMLTKGVEYFCGSCLTLWEILPKIY